MKEREGEPEGGEKMQKSIHYLAFSKLGGAERCMQIDHKEVENDTEKEDERSRSDLSRQSFQSFAKKGKFSDYFLIIFSLCLERRFLEWCNNKRHWEVIFRFCS